MKEKNVEKKIDFQFTAVPIQLTTALDVNCRSMLFTLCQLSDYYADEQGVFFRTNADLSEQSKLSRKLVTATIDTLYIHNIIEVWSVGKGKGKHSNRYRLNFNKFKEYEKYSFDDLKNPEIQICTVKGYNKKGYSPSYLKDDDKECSQENPQYSLIEIPQVPQSTNNIYNIENLDSIDNKEKEYNNTIYNMLEQGMTLEEVAKCLAPTNWDCFVYFKNKLKDNESTRQDYFNLSRVLSDLNYNFNPN